MHPDIGVIFDCDGTLIDSMDVWRELEADLARRAGRELTREDSDIITTLNIFESGAYIHEQLGLGANAAEVVGMIESFMMDYYAHRAEPRPGAVAFVRGLAERGIPLAVASSTPKALLDACMEHVGIADCFRAVVSVDDVGSSKREPAVYDHARESLGTPRNRTWVFEDAAYAFRTLNAAGFRTFAIYDNDMAGTRDVLARSAEHLIGSFEELDADAFLKMVGAL